jgi:hypothetical protein
MTPLKEYLIQINHILSLYIDIHDEIFNFSWRKIIPFRPFFKPIAFVQLSKKLDGLGAGLDKIALQLNDGLQASNVCLRYVQALTEAIRYLQLICDRLDQRAEGHFNKYKYKDYSSDVAVYDGLVKKYSEMGSELNQYVNVV